jgi:hypothetical protein
MTASFHMLTYSPFVVLGGVMVIVFAIGLKVEGLHLAEAMDL